MRYFLTTVLLMLGSIVAAQEKNALTASENLADTLVLYQSSEKKVIRSIGFGKLGHSPHTATMYAAIVPGLGQIYNKKYWKLPILYGGVAALCYAIHFNGKYYKIYRNAYRDFIIRDPNNKSYIEIIDRTSLTVEQVETTYASWFTNALRNKRDYYRRYRDLSYFGLIGVYVIQLVDATVDAHLFDFNVDNDLSLNWMPMIAPDADGPYMGASVRITF